MKVYTPVLIVPHHSGFGMFQKGELQVSPTNSYQFFSDLIEEIESNNYSCLPIVEALQSSEFTEKNIVDIRGKVYDSPSNIYAVIDDYSNLSYFAVVESDVDDNFYN